MIGKGSKVKCTAAGSLQRNTVFTVTAVFDTEWMGEKMKEYTITDGLTIATVTEDVVYLA